MRQPQDAAIEGLLRELKRLRYHFVTPTPATHARVVGRCERSRAADLTDVLGWSLPFARELLSPLLLDHLVAADAVEPAGPGLSKSTLRVSSLRGDLYVHSAYPTVAEDAVFFGPDSYRFADFITAELATVDCAAVRRIVDIGTGAGVGAITAGACCPNAAVIGTDVNDLALRFAAINAAVAGVAMSPYHGSTLAGVEGAADLIMTNPPYIMDPHARAYRDGGEMHGAQVSLDMAAQALPRLSSGGRFLLYTGSAIVRGEDRLREELEKLTRSIGCSLSYRELDPDVFGEELDEPAYWDVDRIAVIGAVMSPG